MRLLRVRQSKELAGEDECAWAGARRADGVARHVQAALAAAGQTASTPQTRARTPPTCMRPLLSWLMRHSSITGPRSLDTSSAAHLTR